MSDDGRSVRGLIARPRLKLRASRARRSVYENLRSDEFRLLEIQASGDVSSGKGLDCTLRRARLSEISSETEYVAVSYTWVDHLARWTPAIGPVSEEITVNGIILPAGRRLAPLLRTLHNFKHTVVWIDAICIDQDDPSERASQVAKMRDVYSRAYQTVIFLGFLTPQSEKFFEFLENVKTAGPVGPDTIQGILEVFQNPYWKRAWIIQEIAVSRRVQVICGEQSCSWESLVSIAYRGDVTSIFDQMDSGTLALGREIRVIDTIRRTKQAPLLTVLRMTRSSMASLRSDAVYAKLGLADDSDELVPKITYRDSAVGIFKRLTKAYIEKKNDLYIVCMTMDTHHADTRLPSWVPDWAYSTERRELLRFFLTGWMRVAHRRSPRMHVSFSKDDNELCVRGTILQTIGPFDASNPSHLDQGARNVFPAICRAIIPDHFVLPATNSELLIPAGFVDQFAVHACVLDSDMDPGSRYIPDGEDTRPETSDPPQRPTQQRKYHSQTRMTARNVRLGDRFHNWYKDNRDVRIGTRTVASWADLYLRDKYSPSGPFPKLHIDANGGIERSLAIMSWHRKLTGTTSGHPALVPERFAEGDLICALYGCPVPVVLRKLSRVYRLIGECYLDGFMDPRLIEDDGTHREHVTFNIR